MNLLKEIFEPIFSTFFVAIPFMFFIIYISPALIFSKLVMGKYPVKYDKKLKDEKLDVVVSLIFSTGLYLFLYIVFAP